jgi:peptide/nickel transport system substrate-binding protein
MENSPSLLRLRPIYVLLISLSLLLAACGGAVPAQGTEEPAGATQPPAATEVSTEPPEQAGPQELVIGAAQDQYRLEDDGANLGIYPLNTNIGETLFKLTPDYKLIPWLAESITYTGDNTWEIKLRQGVKFHNGDELDADAAKWSLEKQSRWQPLVPTDADNIKVVDKYTLTLTTRFPFGRVIESLAHPSYTMYSPKGDPGQTPIATGPFMLESYKQNEELVVVRNPNYWGEPPKLDKITFRFIPDNSTRLLALQSGDVDLIVSVPRENAAQVAAMEDVTLLQAEAAGYFALYFATKEQTPPYDLLTDIRLRQAINYALDKEAIANQVYEGYALPAKSLTPPIVAPAIDQGIQGFSYDPDKAAALLDEAGWTPGTDGIREKDGEELMLTLVSGFPPANLIKPLPEVIKGQLEKVGIGINLVEFNDIGAYYDYLDTGEVHMVIESGSWNTADISFIPYGLFCGCNTEGEAILYKRFWINEDFEEQVLLTLSATDVAEAEQAAVRAAQIWIDEYVGAGPVAYIPNLYGAANKVQGLVIHPSGLNQDWNSVFIAP